MMKKLLMASAFLVAGLAPALADGYFPAFPQVGASANSVCVTWQNGTCNAYAPAGPSALTGSETIPADTHLTQGLAPQTVNIPTAALFGGNLTGNGTAVPFSLYSSVTAPAATTATPERAIRGEISLGSGLTFTSGNLVGVRGEADIPVGTTLAGGSNTFVYGVQGKLVAPGSISGGWDAAVLAQTDFSATTFSSGAIVSGLWVDMGASASASAVSTNFGGNSSMIFLSNATAASTNQIINVAADSSFFATLEKQAGGIPTYVQATDTSCGSGGAVTASKAIAIKVNGVNYFIPLCPTI